MFLKYCSCRFYFVGDEDLLEIIGNSKNLPRLQKHFKKMFAGVSSISIEDDQSQITGVSSKEGEEVKLWEVAEFFAVFTDNELHL